MPELPEVETVRRDLAEVLPGDTIVSIEVRLPKMLRLPAGANLEKSILNQEITGVGRRAKLLIIDLTNGLHLLIHLKMTGQLLWQDKNEQQLIAGGHTLTATEIPSGHANKYTHIIFQLGSGAVLLFNDLRQFGYVELVDDGRLKEVNQKYGPEPLEGEWLEDAWLTAMRRRPRSILKAALLDQSLLAGLGNIYVDEACWRAGIRPQTRVGELSGDDLHRLYEVIPPLLREAVAARGTTFNSYRDGRGRHGTFVSKLAVYGRGGQPCPKCGSPVEKTRVVGRGTHFCPVCQPK
jgi:formamidopyrimidine-DNA glycosylase